MCIRDSSAPSRGPNNNYGLISRMANTASSVTSSAVDLPKASDTTLAAFIWKNAEDLWGDFKHTDFGKIILPFTLLRRLCLLYTSRCV